MSKHEEAQQAQADELQRLQNEIDAVQAETAATLGELVQTQARTTVGEAETATMRSKIIQMQIGAILRETEAQAEQRKIPGLRQAQANPQEEPRTKATRRPAWRVVRNEEGGPQL